MYLLSSPLTPRRPRLHYSGHNGTAGRYCRSECGIRLRPALFYPLFLIISEILCFILIWEPLIPPASRCCMTFWPGFPTLLFWQSCPCCLSSILGMSMGIFSAVRQYSKMDHVCVVVALVFASMPKLLAGADADDPVFSEAGPSAFLRSRFFQAFYPSYPDGSPACGSRKRCV